MSAVSASLFLAASDPCLYLTAPMVGVIAIWVVRAVIQSSIDSAGDRRARSHLSPRARKPVRPPPPPPEEEIEVDPGWDEGDAPPRRFGGRNRPRPGAGSSGESAAREDEW